VFKGSITSCLRGVTDYVSVLNGFLAMQIYKWQQGMCRMFLHIRTELLKTAGFMFVRLASSAITKLLWLVS